MYIGKNILGDFTPTIFFLMTLSVIYNNISLIFIFFIGFLLNDIINRVLRKTIFKKYNEIIVSYKNNIPVTNNSPSGHFQRMAFSLIFFILCYKNNISTLKNYDTLMIYLFLYLTFALFEFYDCIKHQYHTLGDMSIGTLLGFLLGYIYFKLVTKYIKI